MCCSFLTLPQNWHRITQRKNFDFLSAAYRESKFIHGIVVLIDGGINICRKMGFNSIDVYVCSIVAQSY